MITGTGTPISHQSMPFMGGPLLNAPRPAPRLNVG